MAILVHRDFAGAWTEGLAAIGRRELLVEVDHPSLVEAAAEFLRSTATALELERIDVQAGAPIAFGSSTVRFTGIDPSGPLVASELSGLHGRFAPGVSRAARVWQLQQEACRRQGTEFEPPPPHTLVAVSDYVLEPDAIIHGSRHPTSAPGMSGWFLLGPGEEGGRLRYERVVEVIYKLPGVGAYLALPTGHAFRAGRGVDLSIVWDPEIAAFVR